MLKLASVISDYFKPKIIEGQGPDFPESMRNLNKEFENLATNFRLPITYLDASMVFQLSNTVSDDLELIRSNNRPVYEYLFKPKHVFAQHIMKEWNKQYTTDVAFLNDTKQVLNNMNVYKEKITEMPIDCEQFYEIWKETKKNDEFYFKYSFRIPCR
jgi:hypothetical protein